MLSSMGEVLRTTFSDLCVGPPSHLRTVVLAIVPSRLTLTLEGDLDRTQESFFLAFATYHVGLSQAGWLTLWHTSLWTILWSAVLGRGEFWVLSNSFRFCSLPGIYCNCTPTFLCQTFSFFSAVCKLLSRLKACWMDHLACLLVLLRDYIFGIAKSEDGHRFCSSSVAEFFTLEICWELDKLCILMAHLVLFQNYPWILRILSFMLFSYVSLCPHANCQSSK